MSFKDSKRFRAIMRVVMLAGVIILPIIYSLVYLGAFWDPYSQFDKMPVALVNNDKCEENCKSTELVEAIKDDGSFGWTEVSDAEADEGLVNKRFYAELKIPENFTEALEKADSSEREQIEIYYSPNVKTSYIAMMLIRAAVTQIVSELNLNVATAAIAQLSDGVTKAYENTQILADGLEQLSDGSERLADGTGELYSGTEALLSAYSPFNTGVGSAYGGSAKLASGLSELRKSYTELDKGIDSAADGGEQLANGLSSLESSYAAFDAGVSSAASGSEQLANGLGQLQAGVQVMATNTLTDAEIAAIAQAAAQAAAAQFPDDYSKAVASAVAERTATSVSGQIRNKIVENLTTLNGAIGNLKNGADGLKGGLATLSDKSGEVANGISQLSSGTNKLNDGLSELSGGSKKVASGIEQLSDGANDLNNGLGQLANGSNSVEAGIAALNDGSFNLNEGAKTLNAGLATAKNGLDAELEKSAEQVEKLEGLDEYAESAVTANQENYGKTENYGEFFAPYFMSLSVWIGGIMLMVGIYYDPEHRFNILDQKSKKPVLRTFLYFGLSAVQGLTLALLLQLCLGFSVTDEALYLASFALISAAFMSVLIFLFMAFGDFGKFASLVLLVIQLAACGAVFPIETEPAFFQIAQPFMPMTYSVNLLRESLVSINPDFVTSNSMALVGILVVFGAMVICIDQYKRHQIKQGRS